MLNFSEFLYLVYRFLIYLTQRKQIFDLFFFLIDVVIRFFTSSSLFRKRKASDKRVLSMTKNEDGSAVSIPLSFVKSLK